MHIQLENFTACDGSRQFLTLPDDGDWAGMRDHLAALPGAEMTGFLTDWITETWIDFRYRGHEFSLNTQYGEWWVSVADPACPEEILLAVATHCIARWLPEQG